jgi:hypothetical protein
MSFLIVFIINSAPISGQTKHKRAYSLSIMKIVEGIRTPSPQAYLYKMWLGLVALYSCG